VKLPVCWIKHQIMKPDRGVDMQIPHIKLWHEIEVSHQIQHHHSTPRGDCGGAVVKVLRYKSEGCWLDSRCCVIGVFHWHNPSDRTMALGSTQPLTETNTRSISWG
jgi:hypothetical protein